VVKVAFDLRNRALMFSRSPIPHVRDQEDRQKWIAQGIHYRHLGVYAYRREALMAFSKWEPGPLELAENLEQLRFLEHGVAVACALVDKGSPGVDTPDDLHRLEQIIQ
jgi:3-deoxy-manno-octulosonate cytidylyltransferase (CMP-KDO synthetase)